MGKYNFDEVIDRRGTNCCKWDDFEGRYPGYKVAGALPMWVADMEFRCPDAVLEALKAKIDQGIFGYTVPGDEFGRAVKNWLGRRLGWEIEEKWIVPTPGVVAAVAYAVQAFTEEGDGVLIQTPVYYPFKDTCVNLNGRRIEEARLIEEDGYWTMDFEDFEAKAAKEDVKLFVLCSPHNPMGRVWTRQELERLVEICQRHNVLVFSDEIHSDLIMRGYEHTATGLISTENLIVAYAPSKTFNLAGLKTSAIVIPDDSIRRKFKAVMAQTAAGGVNSLGPAALVAAYNECEDWLEELLDYLDGNIRHAAEFVNEKLPGVRASVTEGTYFLWLDFRGTGLSEAEIYKKVLEEAGVAGDLGNWFGEAGGGCVRFNLACPRNMVDEMLRRLAIAFA